MADETDRATLAQRIEQARISAGLPAFTNPAAVADAMIAAGTSIWFHGTVDSDKVIEDRLHALHSRQPGLFADTKPELNGPGPKLDPGFRAFLGGLADDYQKMPADRRLSLWRKFETQRTQQGQPTPAERIRAELTIKYGSVDHAPALDRLRLHHAEGIASRTAAPQPTAAQASAIRALPFSQRGAGLSAVQESGKIKAEIEGLRRSTSGGPMVADGRATEIDRLKRRLVHLRQRFPTLLAA